MGKYDELYHLTYKDNLEKILKEGIVTCVGKNSQICNEERPAVYLCDRDSVPYWAKILGYDCVLKVPTSGLNEAELYNYNYTLYKEWLYFKNIPSGILQKVEVVELDDAKERELVLLYMNILSDLCVYYAKCYLCPERYENEDKRRERLMYISTQARVTIDTMKRLNYKLADMKTVSEMFYELGNDGEYTLFDECDYKEVYGRPSHIYEKLICYSEDEHSETRKALYELICNVFSGCLDISTGGFEV